MRIIFYNIRKFWFVILFIITLLLENCIRHTDTLEVYYLNYFYFPFQMLRVFLYRNVIISVGDILYIFIAIILVVALFRLFLTIIRRGLLFKEEFLRLVRLILLIYVAFLWSWGFNYDRKPLMYEIYKDAIVYDEVNERKYFKDAYTVEQLVSLLDTLQQDLLQYKEVFHAKEHFRSAKINDLSVETYNSLLEVKSIISPLRISTIRSTLQSFGIQGYFVPFTGEIHYTGDLFYLHAPFVFAHEMAHQLGIASETDANVMAYAICSTSNNSAFRASAIFNFMLYILGDVKRHSNEIYESYLIHKMNTDILRLLEELKAHREKYKSVARYYSMGFYDKYLKFFGQKEGLNSYNLMSYKVILYRNLNWSVKDLYND